MCCYPRKKSKIEKLKKKLKRKIYNNKKATKQKQITSANRKRFKQLLFSVSVF